uniref:Uncharacterized protein n=2 Tax=Denticeps clupeoides TaxID=299321 RepID=A0AAY4CI40_9TELE
MTFHSTSEDCCSDVAETAADSSHDPVCLLSPVRLVAVNDDGAEEVQLSLFEDVFMFSSRPHSARRGQNLNEHAQTVTFDLDGMDQGQRMEACLEDDFIASESEEDEAFSSFLFQRTAVHTTSDSPLPAGPTHSKFNSPCNSCTATPSVSPRTEEPAESPRALSTTRRPDHVVPTRCLSPTVPWLTHHPERSVSNLDANMRVSLSKSSLREILREELHLPKVGVGDQPAGSCSHEEEEEEEELRMLASLCRERRQEEEEDEERDMAGRGFGASQLQHSTVSLSTSSDDTITWTQCCPLPDSQGQHYQKEMNPLSHSDPREWMDVLSPPIFPPRQKRSKVKQDTFKRKGTCSYDLSHYKRLEFSTLLHINCNKLGSDLLFSPNFYKRRNCRTHSFMAFTI